MRPPFLCEARSIAIARSRLLKRPKLQDGDQMLRAVAAGVAAATDRQQDPYHNHNLKHHHVCLIEGAAAAPAPAAAAAAAASTAATEDGLKAFLHRCEFSTAHWRRGWRRWAWSAKARAV